VVQLYVHDVAASVTRPVKALRGFERVTLGPGETRSVRFTLGPEDLGFYDQRLRFVVEPGEFRVFVGTSSEGGLEATFRVKKLDSLGPVDRGSARIFILEPCGRSLSR
jgi:beta-glucosidase